jgi:hypothetical protein
MVDIPIEPIFDPMGIESTPAPWSWDSTEKETVLSNSVGFYDRCGFILLNLQRKTTNLRMHEFQVI